MSQKTIIYVNYTPYENQGHVLEFIKESFDLVFMFALGHHNLGKGRRTNKLTIYKNGKEISEKHFLYLPIPPSLVFIVLPIRSVLNLIQILLYSWKIKKKYGKTDVYFTVNGYLAWIGLVLRHLGIVRKTSFWVNDFYPIQHKNKMIQLMRFLYWQFEKLAATSDRVVFINNRLVKLWKQKGLLKRNAQPPVVSIGTYPGRVVTKRNKLRIKLGFLGVIKRSQGLDYMFDSAKELTKAFPDIRLEVFGAGPDLAYFRERAETSPLKVKFHGHVSEKYLDRVLSQCTIGVAPYMPDPTSVSYYGDPGKLKRYIGYGMPIVATNIHEFSKNLPKYKVGAVVEYGDAKQLVVAIKKIMRNYDKYHKNAVKLNKKLYYYKIYPKLFKT